METASMSRRLPGGEFWCWGGTQHRLKLAYFERRMKKHCSLSEKGWIEIGGEERRPALEHSVLFIIHENRAVAASFSRL